MVLDEVDRGRLEKGIDAIIDGMPAFVQMIRSDAMKKQMPLKDENDFIVGMAWGLTLAGFLAGYQNRHNAEIPAEDLGSVGEILFRRTKDIRDAIFSLG